MQMWVVMGDLFINLIEAYQIIPQNEIVNDKGLLFQ